MRWVAGLLLACSGCNTVLGFDPLQDTRSYRKPVTVTQPTAATLNAFPISVILTQDADLAVRASADGSDLVFSDGQSELPAEIVSYDGAGSLEAWVAVPSLPPGPTTIYLGYGGAARTTVASSVWSPGSVGVWHESESGPTAADSSGHGHNLTAPTGTPGSAAGIIGLARAYDGVTAAQMCAADGDGSLELGATSFSYAYWVRSTQTPSGADEPLHKGGSATPGPPGFDVEHGPGAWHTQINDGTQNVGIDYATLAAQNDRWAHVVAVVDRAASTFTVYLDGAPQQVMIPTGFGGVSSSSLLCLGGDQDGSNPFEGLLDEVRIYPTAVSAAWVQLEYANATDRAHVIAIGPEERVR